MQLKGRGILLTGASRGLGAALAKELGLHGAKLALVARDAAPLQRVVDAIRDAGGEAYAIPADVGSKTDIHTITGAAAALVGDIDVLIHDASTLGATPLQLLADSACEDFERVLAVNLVGPFRLTKALVGSMLLREQGLVVHLSSDAAVTAYPRWGAYSASKAALDHLTRIWAAELEGTGVRFFGVDPGDMDTDMYAAAIPDADRSKLGRPADVAALVIRMLEDDSIPTGTRLEANAWQVAR